MRMCKVGFVIAVVSLLAFAGCEKGQMGGQEGALEDALKSSEGPAPVAPEGMTAATIVIGDKNWTVEVAATEDQRKDGLAGRDSLASNTGMWFVFEGDSTDAFWMKDTTFPLDMVFVGADKKVVDVKLNNAALDEDYIVPAAPYRYVLEVAAGGAGGVAVGDIVDYRIGPQ